MRITEADRIRIEQVRELLDNRLNSISIEELAASNEMSESKLSKCFKQLYGNTIYRYHLERRMERAKDRLIAGARVKEVAYQLGYTDSQSFTHAFKRIHHAPPGQFR